MRIKVLRDYSGEEGTDADKNVEAGSEHTVTRARGSALFANGLAEILEDEADEADDAATPPAGDREGNAAGSDATAQPTDQGVESPAGDDGVDNEPKVKAQPTPENKQAPAARNKAAGGQKAEG